MDLRPFKPMIPMRAAAFSSPKWVFEFKFDGYRLIAGKDRTSVDLRTRGRVNATDWFPEICEALNRLKGSCVIDGEVCVLDAKGLPDFLRLASRRSASLKAARARPAVLFAFDLLWLNGKDLRGESLQERKSRLQKLLPAKATRVIYVPHVPEHGLQLFAAACTEGLEGVIAKRAGSHYHGGDTRDWLKFICPRYQRRRSVSG